VITQRDLDLVDRAKAFSKASPDTSRKTGCVIDTYNSLWEGYALIYGCNNFPDGVLITPERLSRPLKYAYTEHAERMAIYKAAAAGIELSGSTMYLSWYPCADCARAIVLSEIKRLVCLEPDWSEERYGFNDARQILSEGGVTVDFVLKEG
jgi:dCMP deaminase